MREAGEEVSGATPGLWMRLRHQALRGACLPSAALLHAGTKPDGLHALSLELHLHGPHGCLARWMCVHR
jgi:hypothetical protein